MALSLSFKLPERGRSVHTERANELESNSKVLNRSARTSYLPLLNRKVITRAWGARILAPYLRKKTQMLSLIYSGRGKETAGFDIGSNLQQAHPMSPFTPQCCSTPAPSTLAYCSMPRDISRASLDSSSATYTAPFLNPLTTAKAALYFSCCRRWLTVYRMVFTSSGPAMVRSAVPDTTLMSVAHTHVPKWCVTLNTRRANVEVRFLCKFGAGSCFWNEMYFFFVCLFKVYCKWFQAEASTQSINAPFTNIWAMSVHSMSGQI